MELMGARRGLLSSIHGSSAEGFLIPFETDLSAKLKKCMAGNDTNPIVHLSKRNIVPSDAVYTPNYFVNSSGIVSYNTNYMMYDKYIPIIPGLTYAIRFIKNQSGAVGFTVPFYDADYTFVGRAVPFSAASGTGLRYGTFTAPANAAYIRYSLPKNSQNVQIEIGDTYTDYDNSAVTDYANSVKTNIGKNVIWSEAGHLSLSYWTH